MTSGQGPQTAAPIRVLVAGEGKQLFERSADPRVQRLALPEAVDAPVDLVVVPLPTSHELQIPDPGLPQAAWDRAAGVVLDASAEGREHAPQRTEALHRLLQAKGVAPSRAVYLTQERNYRADYRAFCQEGGIRPMAVLEHDFWIWRFAVQFDRTGETKLSERRAEFRARLQARERRFVSLNFTPRPAKVLFLLSLMRDGLWDQGFVSFGGFQQYQLSVGRDLDGFRRLTSRLKGFEDLARELDPLLPRLADYGQVLLGDVDRAPEGDRVHKAPLLDRKMSEYDRSWFSIVTETEMRPRRSRITEKALKPLVNFHPLIAFGNPGALQMLRDLGFHTFGQVIDERYDDESDPRRRFEMGYAEVRRLCGLDEAELARMEARIAETLEHNAVWGLIEMPHIRRAEHEAALVDRILAAVGARAG